MSKPTFHSKKFLVLAFVLVSGVGGAIRGCAAGQGMVFVLSVLNRVYNSARVCPKQGIQFRGSLSLDSVHDLC